MPYKNTDLKTYEIPLPGGRVLHVECYTERKRNYVSEHAKGQYAEGRDLVNVCGRYAWSNRPWQDFQYSEAIRGMARNLDEEDRAAVLEWCEKHARGEAEKAGAFLDDFKSEWEKASPGLKSAIQAGGMIETEDQAKSTLAVLKMGNLLRELENN